MALKNPDKLEGISKGIPTQIANKAYVNALFQAKYGRDANKAELDKFTKKTVEDSANLVLGKEDSPFYGNIQPSQQELKNIEQTGGTKYELKEAGREAELTPTTGGEFGAGAGGGAGAGTGDTKPDITKPVPPKVKFKDTAEYKNLSQDMKDFVDLSYNLIEFGGEDEAKQFTNAITQAKGIADPYFKAQLTLALGDVQAAIAKQNGDYKTAKDLIDNANKELQDNLTANRDLLDLNNAAEIARAFEQYTQDSLAIADQAAEKGLTFNTGAKSRELAQAQRDTQNLDIVESRTRTYNAYVADLTRKATAGNEEARIKLDDLGRTKTSNLSGIGRAYESIVGSGAMNTEDIDPITPGVQTIAGGTGYTPIGGVIGSMEEAKRKSMISDTNAFYNLQNPILP